MGTTPNSRNQAVGRWCVVGAATCFMIGGVGVAAMGGAAELAAAAILALLGAVVSNRHGISKDRALR